MNKIPQDCIVKCVTPFGVILTKILTNTNKGNEKGGKGILFCKAFESCVCITCTTCN